MLDLTKPMQTRGGRPARFLGKLNTGDLVFAVMNPHSNEYLVRRDPQGGYDGGLDELDIINTPRKGTVVIWQGVQGPLATLHNDGKDEALIRKAYGCSFIKSMPVEY